MENIVTSIRTRGDSDDNENLIVASTKTASPVRRDADINNPEEALEVLKSKPDVRLLAKTLRWLTEEKSDRDGFSIHRISPKSSQILFTLLNDIVPDYWHIFSGEGASNHAKERRLLISCLRNVVGIGAISSRLRSLLGELKTSKSQSDKLTQLLEDLLNVLEHVLQGKQCVESIWKGINAYLKESPQMSLQWKELLSLIASGKMLAVASETSFAIKERNSSFDDDSWVCKGNSYASWLGENIQYMTQNVPPSNNEGQKSISQLISKALNLGYRDHIIKAAFSDMLQGKTQLLRRYQALVGLLPPSEQKTFLYTLIEVLSKEKLQVGLSNDKANPPNDATMLAAVAALIAGIVDENTNLQADLSDWLVGLSAAAPAYSHLTHRAVIAVVANHHEQAFETLRRCLQLFGDKLYIKHSPTLHQEVIAQILLMLTGYCFRADRSQMSNITRSSVYLNTISNRLAASSSRARFLGMVVGTATSELVDSPDMRMKFGTEELDSSDGMWYRKLPTVNDSIGVIEDFKTFPSRSSEEVIKAGKPAKIQEAPTKSTAPKKAASKIISIEELDESSESEDEDLPMYEKPDSDPSDEDEDPTLVQRNKPTAPVYIRDLIAGLRDTEDFDRHKLALTNAASLVRRKAAFGTEVSDNIEDLATLLVGLGDKWEMDDFQNFRLQGMIAVLTAEPLKMGQWFSKTFYNGDYSMGQRASVLTTLSMGARELAGLGKEDAALTGAIPKEDLFPSKRLPEKLHKIYALEAAPMNALSSQLERTMIQPMAAAAADQVTGPNALKVRTFSSRMAVEKKRQKPIPNALAKVVAEGFFFPLAGRWRIHLQSYGENSTHTSPFLLSHLLKTLALILHASGSSTLSLPQMTAEFWDLLLSLRPRAADPSVLEALLFAFLTMLNINGGDLGRLAREHAKELLETQDWVGTVFERVGGGSEEGDKIRMLAAGVLMRTREVVEKYQRSLVGDMVDYMG
ncbi:telomere binding protein [Lecanora helva]